MNEIYCLGVECPNKNQCLLHTHQTTGTVIRKCTNRKKFVQDKEKINGDSLRK